MELTFSAVDNFDIPMLVRALRISGHVLKLVEDVKSRRRLELTLDDGVILHTRKAILLAMAGVSPDRGPLLEEHSPESVRLALEQALEWTCGSVLEELMHRQGRDVEGVIFGPLQEDLAKRAFVAGGSTPSLADWSLFALLFNRLKAMTPSIAAKYYRLVRWANYLQQGLVSGTEGAGDATSLDAFVPISFDLGSIWRALEGISPIEGGGRAELPPQKKKKDEERAGAAKKTIPKDESGQGASRQPITTGSTHPFSRVDLRVGKIVSIEKHPQADRLYVEQVDLGEGPEQARTVVSGLVEHVPIEQLQGRHCVFICNLKPASLCKVLSSAMLLVAKSEDGATLEPLIPPPGSQAGDRIVIDGVEAFPDEVIKPKESTWEEVRSKLCLIEGVATYKDSISGLHRPLLVSRPGLASSKITSGKVPTGIIS